MKRIGLFVTCVIILLGIFPINALAASSWQNISVGALPASPCYQGEVLTFTPSISTGIQSDAVYACGLTSMNVVPEDLFTSSGTVYRDQILYTAQVSSSGSGISWRFTLTLDTKNVPPGEYRFIFVVVWRQNMAVRSSYFHYDLTIIPAETPSSWAQEEVSKAISSYLVPNRLQYLYTSPATRDAFAEVVVNAVMAFTQIGLERYIGNKGMDLITNPFTDTSKSYVIAANKLGIITGVGEGVFDPGGTLTREQAATMIWRMATQLGVNTGGSAPVSFADASSISPWAADAVAFVSSKGIMSGTGNNMFSPKDDYTYQQCYISIYRAYSNLYYETNIDTSPLKPSTSSPQPMSTPFTSVGQTYSITDAGINNDMLVIGPSGYETQFVINLAVDSPERERVVSMAMQSHLLAPDGTVYYHTSVNIDSVVSTGSNSTKIEFQLPKSVNIPELTFVCAGEWRKLEGTAPKLNSDAPKAMSEPFAHLTEIYTIDSAGVDNSFEISGMKAHEQVLAVKFSVNRMTTSSVMSKESYLLAPDGSVYFSAQSNSSYSYGVQTLTLAFPVPKSIEVSAFTFVCDGEWRKLG